MDNLIIFLILLCIMGFIAMGIPKPTNDGITISYGLLVTTLILMFICGGMLVSFEAFPSIIVMVLWVCLLYGLGIAAANVSRHVSNYVANKLIAPICLVVYLGGIGAIILAPVIFS